MTATVEENVKIKQLYVIEIPDMLILKIQQPETEGKCIFNQRYHSILYPSR